MTGYEKRIALLLTFAVAIVLFSCKDDGGPPPPNGPDTTSHNWIFRVDTLGEFGSSFKDVTLLSDGTAWAVGRIMLRDSSGQIDPAIYNGAKWDGQQWLFSRISSITSDGRTVIAPLTSIFAVENTNIVVSSDAGAISRWNGATWTSRWVSERSGGINRIWGINTKLYLVGTNGSVTFADGSVWQRLESNTSVDLLDVWGSPDGSVVWACGYKDLVGTVLLKITGTTVEKVYDDLNTWSCIRQDSLSGVLTGVWTDGNKVYLVGSSGLYEADVATRGAARRIWYDFRAAPGLPHWLRGSSANDLFAGGDFTSIYHYNGSTVHYYADLQSRIRWWSAARKSDTLIAVGANNDTQRAVVLWGRKPQ